MPGIRPAIAMAAILLSGAAPASEWHLVDVTGEAPTKQAYFIDTKSIRGSLPIRTAWIQVVNERLTDNIRAMRTQYEYDCARGRLRTRAIISHDDRGEAVKFLDTEDDWRQPDGDSIGERQLGIVCRGDSPLGKMIAQDPVVDARVAFASIDEAFRRMNQPAR